MTAQEFNAEMVRELGFTLTHWPGAKPGNISRNGRAIFFEPQPPIREIRPATVDDWKRFRVVATRLYRPPLRNMPADTWCVEAAD